MEVRKNPDAFKRLRSMSEALKITDGDLAGPVLVRLGQLHRKQMNRIFASEGAEGGAGRWEPLDERYAARKRKVSGRAKILKLTGRMRDAFTKPSNPDYVQTYSPGLFQFGARSAVAAAHFFGDPSLSPEQSSTARSVFGGTAPRLPVRDMITKTSQHLEDLRERITTWYAEERIPQVLRNIKAP